MPAVRGTGGLCGDPAFPKRRATFLPLTGREGGGCYGTVLRSLDSCAWDGCSSLHQTPGISEQAHKRLRAFGPAGVTRGLMLGGGLITTLGPSGFP